jgi:hypothetical protein
MGDDTQNIEVHDFESDTVEKIEIPVDEVDTLPMNARNVGRVYRAFTKGRSVRILKMPLIGMN